MNKKDLGNMMLNSFSGAFGKIACSAALGLLMYALPVNAATYYVSSHAGDDGNDGLSAETAWKSLEKVNSMVFEPGDSLLLASESVFKGQLSPKGSGAMKDGRMVPVVLDRFGKGALPRIDGEGKVNAPLFLHNIEGWEIQNVELTNTGTERENSRYGLYVLIDAMPVARHFMIRNVTVRDVNGALPKVHDDIVATAIRLNATYEYDTEIPGRCFEGVLIEDCTIRNCERNGILVSGTTSRQNWNPSTDVVIRRNLLEGVGGDGILPMGCHAPLIEWNVMRNCPDYGAEIGASAGMWPWACDDAVFQFNEVVGLKSWVDSQAYDCDYNCNNTVYQYNLSRDNKGGFMLICAPGQKEGWFAGNSWNRGSIVRYNLSINDGYRIKGNSNKKDYFSPAFSITGGTVRDTDIYGNLFIIPKKPDPKMDTDLVDFDNWGGKFPINTSIRDNVFVMLDGQPGTFDFGKARQIRFENNRFYGDVKPIVESHDVKSSGDQFLAEVPKTVTISGLKGELSTFAEFLAKKGNPQEEAGITIQWDVKER